MPVNTVYKPIHCEDLGFLEVTWLLLDLRYCTWSKSSYYMVHERIGIKPAHIITPTFYLRGDLFC